MKMGSRAELAAPSSYCCQQGRMGQMDNCWTGQQIRIVSAPLHHLISPAFPPGIFKTHWADRRRKTRTSRSEHMSSTTHVSS